MGWDSAAELGSTWGLLFLFGLYRGLGRLPFRLIAGPIVLWFYLFKPAPRRASLEYLSRALGRPAGFRDGLRHFFSFTETTLDKLIAWNGGFAPSDLEFHGLEKISATLSEGKGLLLIGSHLGNLEAGRALSKLRPGLELHVLVHTRHAENFNRMMRRLDPASQANLHQVAEMGVDLAAWVSERVGRGAVVLLSGDRVPIGAGARVSSAPFFGRPADFPQGPYILASALGCPVMLLFCLRRPGGRSPAFDVYYEAFAERIVLPRADRERALSALAARYAARLEYYCARAPHQWYNFFPFWREAGKK